MDEWADLGERRRAARPSSSPGSSPGRTSAQSLPSHLMASLDLWKHYIHGLSQIEFHHRPGRDLPAWSRATQSDRDHAASLDGLALLLVFSPKGDVAAISYWQSAGELKLLWAKNQPVNDSSQLQYIEELLENAKNGTQADELLKIVIPMCREKIFHRIRKLANSFDVSKINQKQEKSNLWRFDETEKPHQKLEAALKEAGWLSGNKSIISVLDSFTRLVGRTTKTSGADVFWIILYFSWCVTSIADLDKILGEDQVRYLSKLGDYVRILERIPLLLRKPGITKITVEQVRPPAAEPIEVLSSSLEVLNLRCSHIISDEIKPIEDWDLVTDVYQKAQLGQPAFGKKKITFTQHCEITLALDMIARHTLPKPTNPKIEIGVSKACCEWCCDYLNLLASAYPQYSILVRASHGKQPGGWMIPPNGPKSIASQMSRLVEGKIDNVIWEVNKRRRSDSNELPSSLTKEANLGTRKQAITKVMLDRDMSDIEGHS